MWKIRGAGLIQKIWEKFFDPFFTTKEVGMGTGLGLSICYGIIEQHHGSIMAVSHVGEGTRFTITLPLRAPGVEEGRSA